MPPLDSCVVVVTPRSFDARLRPLLEARVGEVRYQPGPLSAEQLAEVAEDADGLIAGLDEINDIVFARAKRLRVVARYGVGVDQVDLQAAARRGVTVTITPGANSNSVAELTIALMFALARPLLTGHREAREGRWPSLHGLELRGRTLGLIGVGRVGSLVAEKANALGMRVFGHDPYVTDSVTELVDLTTLAALSDFVSLHAPLTDQTRAIVDEPLLSKFKAGTFLVNTARGELIDEDALLRALNSGQLAAVALDTVIEEPPPIDHPFRHRDDVLLTPHLGSHTAEATAAMGKTAIDELLAVLSGLPPRFACELHR